MNAALLVPAPRAVGVHRGALPASTQASAFGADDTALSALTDFRQERPLTMAADRAIEDALAAMKQFGTHALLVVQDDPDDEAHRVLGLLTRYDIERKNPHRYPGGPLRRTHGLKVSDVMTPWTDLSLVHYDSLIDLTAGELLERFQGSGLTHLLVIETRIDESAVARGLLSRAVLSKSLPRPAQPSLRESCQPRGIQSGRCPPEPVLRHSRVRIAQQIAPSNGPSRKKALAQYPIAVHPDGE